MAKIRHPFAPLRFSNYRTYLIGMICEQLALEIQTVVLTWQLYLLTHSPLSLGFIGLARFVPVFVFSLLGGIIADMFDRKKLLVLANSFMALFALIFLITLLNGWLSPLLIYLLIGGLSAIDSFHLPARQSSIPTLIPKEYLTRAVGFSSTVWQSTRIIGPAIGGFLLAGLNLPSIYAIIFSFFVLTAISRLFLHIPAHSWEKQPTFSLKTLFEGIHFVRKSPLIWSTMVLDFIATFFGSATTLLPIFAKDILAVGPQGLGILYSSSSIGAVIAGFVFSSLNVKKHQGKILLGAVIIYGIATIVFGLSHAFYISILMLAITGVGDMVSTIIRNTIRQLATPDHLRGRMVSINMLFFIGGPQLGEVEAGFAAHVLGTPLSVVVGGVGTVVATMIIALIVPKLRNYHSHETIA